MGDAVNPFPCLAAETKRSNENGNVVEERR